jgi:hypothetical protein
LFKVFQLFNFFFEQLSVSFSFLVALFVFQDLVDVFDLVHKILPLPDDAHTCYLLSKKGPGYGNNRGNALLVVLVTGNWVTRSHTQKGRWVVKPPASIRRLIASFS